jgi:hypothetical protein
VAEEKEGEGRTLVIIVRPTWQRPVFYSLPQWSTAIYIHTHTHRLGSWFLCQAPVGLAERVAMRCWGLLP